MEFIASLGHCRGGLAVEQTTQRVAFERFHALELAGGGDQRGFFRGQKPADAVVRAVEDGPYLLVDRARGRLAEIALAAESVRFQKERVALAVGGEADALRHA